MSPGNGSAGFSINNACWDELTRVTALRSGLALLGKAAYNAIFASICTLPDRARARSRMGFRRWNDTKNQTRAGFITQPAKRLHSFWSSPCGGGVHVVEEQGQ